MTREQAQEQVIVVVDECLEQEGINVITMIYDDFQAVIEGLGMTIDILDSP